MRKVNRYGNGDGSSVVSERFAFFKGKDVKIRFNSLGEEPLTGIFLDILPAGRTYLVKLMVGDLIETIATDDIARISEVAPPALP